MRLKLIVLLIVMTAVPAAAQERPFLFSIATSTEEKPGVRFDYDVGVGERAFQSDVSNQPEQRLGVQTSHGRLTLLARVGISDVGSAYQSSQSGELLYSMFAPTSSQISLAAGGGMLHEPDGANVLLVRVVAGRNADTWLLHGNLLFQKPYATGRDAVDLVTSVGWARKLPHRISLGVEAVGEDLEGFWESEEAEGGARLLAGPSLHVSAADQRWQFVATGGPLFHPSDTGRSSAAFRDLPPDTRRSSYAFKMSLSIALVSAR